MSISSFLYLQIDFVLEKESIVWTASQRNLEHTHTHTPQRRCPDVSWWLVDRKVPPSFRIRSSLLPTTFCLFFHCHVSLLRNILHFLLCIKFTHFKCTAYFITFIQLCSHHHNAALGLFNHPIWFSFSPTPKPIPIAIPSNHPSTLYLFGFAFSRNFT